jgi:very-short-patch-repair endonuclease
MAWKKRFYSSPDLLLAARGMRREPTEAEKVLWQALQKQQLDGTRFRRQQVVGSYILDFYCLAYRLAIEVDGKGHEETGQKQYDQERTDFLSEKGITVLRFPNNRVVSDLEGVLCDIRAWIEKTRHD